jgi:hypothetical protein
MFAGKSPSFRRLIAGGLLAGLSGCGHPPAVVEIANASNKPAAQDSSAAAADKPGPDAPGQAPVLPDDAGGKAVRGLLAPTPVSSTPTGPRGPVPLAAPALREPLPPLQVNLPRRALTPAEKGLRPRSPGEDAQSLLSPESGAVPARPAVPTPGPARVSSPDPNEPVRLGFVGLLVADRVPLDDPTAEASLRAALSGTVVGRVTPVPFTPSPLPDPFQNGETVRLKTPPPEDEQPRAGSRK